MILEAGIMERKIVLKQEIIEVLGKVGVKPGQNMCVPTIQENS